MDKKVLSKIGYGLYVLTARDGEKDNGCILNTVMQLTGAPIRLLVGINKRNYTFEMIEKTDVFNISLLTEDVPFEIIRHFGFQSGRDVNKFPDSTDEYRAENGVLYIPTYTNSYLSCKVVDKSDYGTHMLYVAEVEDAKMLSDGESLTYAMYHKKIKAAPEDKPKSGYRCKICNYIYEGEPLPPDFICPICKHGAEDFEKI